MRMIASLVAVVMFGVASSASAGEFTGKDAFMLTWYAHKLGVLTDNPKYGPAPMSAEAFFNGYKNPKVGCFGPSATVSKALPRFTIGRIFCDAGTRGMWDFNCEMTAHAGGKKLTVSGPDAFWVADILRRAGALYSKDGASNPSFSHADCDIAGGVACGGVGAPVAKCTFY